MNTPELQTVDTLYYDGKCALCAHEINLLKKWQRGKLSLIDIHRASASQLAEVNRSQIELLSVLHLRTKSGDVLTGLDATARAWSHTVFGFLFALLRWPLIRPVADYVYQRWAVNRACKLGYDSCEISK